MRDPSSEPLSEARLDELLGGLRIQPAYTRTDDPHGRSCCLSLDQARLWVLDPTQLGAAERAHPERCARCARLCAQMARSMPHLPWRLLLLAELGLLPAASRRGVERHLREGCCVQCTQRAQRLHGYRERLATCTRPTPLPHPQALMAGSSPFCIVASSADDSLEAELSEEDALLVLEVRSRDARLNHHLVGFLVYGRGRSCVVEGFTVLHPDVDGWYTGHAEFTKEELYSSLHGCCEGLVVSPVDASLLGPPEWKALEASVRRLADPVSRLAWIRWLETTESRTLPEALPLSTLLAQVGQSGQAAQQ